MGYNPLPCDTEHLALTGKSVIHCGWNDVVLVTSSLATKPIPLVY